MGYERLSSAVVDPLYIAARRVLLDALSALQPHRDALIVAGAQAIYLRTGSADLAVAPYTTDGDLVLDPHIIADSPAIETSMRAAGFRLQRHIGGHVEPGVWLADAYVAGDTVLIPVDLLVPEAIAPPGGRRAARLTGHDRRSTRRAVGLEAALVDNSTMTVAALDPKDNRTSQVKVAGLAALVVAKAHKLHDRLVSGRRSRVDDKDAADVIRIMQASSAEEIASTLAVLRDDEVAGTATTDALRYIEEMFGRRGSRGIDMASRALRGALPESQIQTLCLAYASILCR